jgi:hypothetical protein
MRLFDYTQAQHFCQPLPVHVPGIGQSLANLYGNSTTHQLREGTSAFEIHRVSLLNNVERWILFGVGQYRRAFDMFIPSNAAWAQVTLYYSSFYAANAILGMFGVWIHLNHWADVESGLAPHQIINIHRRAQGPPSGYKGSHRKFWDLYYEACTSFAPWVPVELAEAVTPINNDRIWQISARNEVNYDMAFAFDASLLMDATGNPKRLDEYGGQLGQQREVTEKTLQLAVHFANEFQVSSFPFEGLHGGPRQRALRALVTKPAPSLVTQSVLQELFR